MVPRRGPSGTGAPFGAFPFESSVMAGIRTKLRRIDLPPDFRAHLHARLADADRTG
jgi:hypothetical protein